MKKIAKTLLLLVCIQVQLSAQTNSDNCDVFNKTAVMNQVLQFQLDSTPYDLLIDHTQDDLSNYDHPNPEIPGANYNRCIYFVHGLGGGEHSWNPVYNWFTSVHTRITDPDPAIPDEVLNNPTFIYVPYKASYNFYGSYNQSSFDNACDILQNSMKSEFMSYNVAWPYSYDRTYAIGHSQGGLVLRSLDMFYEAPQYLSNGASNPFFHYNLNARIPLGVANTIPNRRNDNTVDDNKRLFNGIITFGTPHGGAEIAKAQGALVELGTEIAMSGAVASFQDFLTGITLSTGIPIQNVFTSLDLQTNNGKVVLDNLKQQITSVILPILGDGRNDPITLQYTPDAAYLQVLNNYNTEWLPKAVFYGEEEEPVFWRVAQGFLKDTGKLPAFSANSDDKIMKAVQEMISASERKKLDDQVDINVKRSQIQYYYSGYPAIIPYLLVRDIKKRIDALQMDIDAHIDFVSHLEDANKRFKNIIGCYQLNSNYSNKIVTTICQCNSGSNRLKPFYYDGEVDCETKLINCNSDFVQTRYLYESQVIEYPSDGTVLTSSQRAFPGCLDKYKHVMRKTNHLQERNSLETYKALLMIYRADNTSIPAFFKLRELK